MNYLFDVDGTLTPSRNKIDSEFQKFFLNFCNQNNVYLVTGSDRPKTIEQIGEEVYNACKKVYNCSGNSVWIKDKCIYESSWELPKEIQKDLKFHLHNSQYPRREGNHIEHRPGMVNFSIVGRNCSQKIREDYSKYDHEFLERDSILKGDVRTVDMIDDAIINFGHRIANPDWYTPIRPADSLVKIKTVSGGHAYGLTPKTAQWLIDDVENNGVNINVDEWINLKCGLPLYALEPSQVVCWPRVSTREWQEETNEKREMAATWTFSDEFTESWKKGFKIN